LILSVANHFVMPKPWFGNFSIPFCDPIGGKTETGGIMIANYPSMV
jgi:hypothetical protein